MLAEYLVGHGPDEIFTDGIDDGLIPVGPWSEVSDPFTGQQDILVLGASDTLGRDEFLRLLYGGRVSLQVAVLATLGAMTIGTIVGAAGWLLPRLDRHGGVEADGDHDGVPGDAVHHRDGVDARQQARRRDVRRRPGPGRVDHGAGLLGVRLVLPGPDHAGQGAVAPRRRSSWKCLDDGASDWRIIRST